MPRCLIKSADKSSYGPLSRAGIEYNTYLASKLESDTADGLQYRQHERRVKPRPKSCIANTSMKAVKRNVSFDIDDSAPSQSVYSGLSYVPFNYCDDLQIDDIYDVLKNRRHERGLSVDSGHPYSPDSENFFGAKSEYADHHRNDYRRNDSTDEQPVEDTYKVSKISYYIPRDGDDYKKRVTHYASSEGLSKSPKQPVRQRITVRIGTKTESAPPNHVKAAEANRYYSSDEDEIRNEYSRENESFRQKDDNYEHRQGKYQGNDSYCDSRRYEHENRQQREPEGSRDRKNEYQEENLIDDNDYNNSAKYDKSTKLPPNSEMIAKKYSRYSFLNEEEQKLNDKYNKKKYGGPNEDEVFQSQSNDPQPKQNDPQPKQKKKVNVVLRCSSSSSSNSERIRTHSSEEYPPPKTPRNQDNRYHHPATQSAENLLDASAADSSDAAEKDEAFHVTKQEHFKHCRRSLQEQDMYLRDGKIQEWFNADGSYSAKFIKRKSSDHKERAFSKDRVLSARALKSTIEDNINQTLERQRHYPFRVKRLTSDKYQRFLPKDDDEEEEDVRGEPCRGGWPCENYPDIYKNSAKISFEQLWGTLDDSPIRSAPQVHHPIATLPRKPKTANKKPDGKRERHNRIISVEGFRSLKGSSGHNRSITNVYELARDGWIDKTKKKMKKKMNCLNLDAEVEKLIKKNSRAVINLGKLKLIF